MRAQAQMQNATKRKLIMAHSLNRNNLTAASMLSAPANDAERQETSLHNTTE